MPQDYKNRIPAYRNPRKKPLAQNWGLIGAAAAGLMALGALGFYFVSKPEGLPTAPANPAATEAAADDPSTAVPASPRKGGAKEKPSAGADDAPLPPPHEPRFSFYKLLPEKEIVVGESDIKTLKREEIQGRKSTSTFLLQAGSFTNQADADRLKAKLAEINVKAKLEMIKLDNTAWYRVKVGPYATLADADKVRQYLRGNHIDSIVQKSAQ